MQMITRQDDWLIYQNLLRSQICGICIFCYYQFFNKLYRMPKIKPKEQDQSYDGPEPKVYRKYAKQTKQKLWKMVEQGKKPNSAAKLLKIKSSTAKMMIKKINAQIKTKEFLKNQAISAKQPSQINAESERQNKEVFEKYENNMQGQPIQYWVIFPTIYYFYSPQAQKND